MLRLHGFISLLPLAFWIQVVRSSAESELIHKLMVNYSSDSRPVMDSRQPININITLSLSHILDLDEKKELFDWVVWIQQEWVDEYLTWDPSQHGGLESVHINMVRLWSPDLYIYNLVGESVNVASSFLGTGREVGVISYTGRILNFMPVRLKTICKVDLKYFPFDSQTCHLRVGSWAYSEKALIYHLGGPPINMLDAESGAAWRLVGVTQKQYSSQYEDVPDNYTLVDFDINVARNPLFYVLNMLIPSYLLSGVMLMSVFLPPGCGERMSVGLTVFMSYSVYTLIISSIVPDSSRNPPIVCILLLINMILTLLTVSWTVFVIRIEFTSSTWKAPPGRFCFTCSSLFKLPRMHHTKVPPTGREASSLEWRGKKCRTSQLLQESKVTHKDRSADIMTTETPIQTYKYNDVSMTSSAQKHHVKGSSSAPGVGERNYKAEWQALAQLGDKVVAVVYVVVIVSGLLILFASIPRS